MARIEQVETKVIENVPNDQSRYCFTLLNTVLFPYDFLFNWLASFNKSFIEYKEMLFLTLAFKKYLRFTVKSKRMTFSELTD